MSYRATVLDQGDVIDMIEDDNFANLLSNMEDKYPGLEIRLDYVMSDTCNNVVTIETLVHKVLDT